MGDQVVAQEGLDEPPAAPAGPLLFELVDRIDEVEEAAAGV